MSERRDTGGTGMPAGGGSNPVSDPAIFEQYDIWGEMLRQDPPPDRYGRLGAEVAALIAQARGLNWAAIDYVASISGYANQDSEAREADEQDLRRATSDAVTRTGRIVEARRAFLDGQAAIFWACNPVMGALEHWWNSFPEVVAMESAGYAAAALTVADVIDASALHIALWPWRSLRSGQPRADAFGPASHEVLSIIEESAHLTVAQADRIVTAWAEPERARVIAWRAGASSDWPPPVGPPTFAVARASLPRDLRWSRQVDTALRRVAIAHVPEQRRVLRASFYAYCLSNATRDAVLAAIASDVLEPRVVRELEDPWQRRDELKGPDPMLIAAILGDRG